MTICSSAVPRWVVRFGALSALLFVAGPVLAHTAVLSAMVGFGLFGLGGLTGVFAALTGLVAGIRRHGSGRWAAWRGTFPALAVAGAFVYAGSRGGNLPAINDITTDTVQPPQFVEAGRLAANRDRDLSYPGDSFARQQQLAYPDLQPLRLDVAPDRAYEHVLATARRMPTWSITRADGFARALEGTATSVLFRFQDDFVIEVREENGQSVVHMRSKSRDGKGDLGANARRIRAFLSRVQEAATASPQPAR
jgi:uncharacterized protein (DUF1499 family)